LFLVLTCHPSPQAEDLLLPFALAFAFAFALAFLVAIPKRLSF
jgi:hypothetical protein